MTYICQYISNFFKGHTAQEDHGHSSGYYPMTETQFMQRRGMHGCLDVFTGHGIKGRTHASAEIIHFPTHCIIRTWKAPSLWPHASQALMMHLFGKCVISAWTRVLVILPHYPTIINSRYAYHTRWDGNEISLSHQPHEIQLSRILFIRLDSHWFLHLCYG